MTAQRSENADGHRYYIHPVTGESLPSVTTIIEGTQDKPWLGPWRSKLAAEWCADNAHLRVEMTRDEFIKAAKGAAQKASEIKADAGSYGHEVIAATILGWADPANAGDINLPVLPDHLADVLIDGIPAQEFADKVIAGFHRFVEDHAPRFEASEMTIFNRLLGYAGTLDITAWLRLLRDLGCLDVKTGLHLGAGTQEQFAAYRRALECLMPLGEVLPMPPTVAGLILHLRPEYPDGYRLIRISDKDDAAAWNRFRRALLLFNERKAITGRPGTVVYPPLPDGSQPPMRLADVEGYRGVPALLAKAGVRTVADIGRLDAKGLLAIDGIGPARAEVAFQICRDLDPGFTGHSLDAALAVLRGRDDEGNPDLEGAA